MTNVKINDLKTTKLEKLNLFVNSEGYLKEISEQEKDNVYGGCHCSKVQGGYICTK